MKRKALSFSCFILFLVFPSLGTAEQTLVLLPVTESPTVDGLAADPAWQKAPALITHDNTANLSITIKGVYTETDIFFLVSFPDADESRTHKSWTWDKGREIYTVGHDREDVFIFKWNMESTPVDLSIYADSPYKADIWYWKACRTDGSGYADDKMHVLSPKDDRNATEIISRSGNKMYLLRTGDTGKSAYTVDLVSEYQGDIVNRFAKQQPTGSRSDVRARGVWQNGVWTLEFGRKLATGNQDDVQFSPGKKYLFGVSRYEIAGRQPNAKLSEPLYGAGDVSETLWIEFMQ